MIKQKIQKLFHIWQGHQITDEEIYNSKTGKYPILTGHNEVKGLTDHPYIAKVPCITIPSKGVVNSLYLQIEPFDANNTIALIPKDRKTIDLEYFIFAHLRYITSFISSTSTNNYLNKEILRDVEIDLPNFPDQTKIRDEYKRLSALKKSIQSQTEILNRQVSRSVRTLGEPVTVDDVFSLKVGSDDKMTENYAYDNKGNIPIYSERRRNNGIFRYTKRIDYSFKDYITWSISGKAGTLHLRHGPCCLTRDCGIMIPRDKKRINLEWFILTQESSLMDFAIGRGGLGRLKKNLIELYSFELPKRVIQNQIVDEYNKIITIRNKLETLNQMVDTQLEKVVLSA